MIAVTFPRTPGPISCHGSYCSSLPLIPETISSSQAISCFFFASDYPSSAHQVTSTKKRCMCKLLHPLLLCLHIIACPQRQHEAVWAVIHTVMSGVLILAGLAFFTSEENLHCLLCLPFSVLFVYNCSLPYLRSHEI